MSVTEGNLTIRQAAEKLAEALERKLARLSPEDRIARLESINRAIEEVDQQESRTVQVRPKIPASHLRSRKRG